MAFPTHIHVASVPTGHLLRQDGSRSVKIGWGSVCHFPTDCPAELCKPPPEVRNAVFRAPAYKVGTVLNCQCETGFRRVSRRPFVRCTGNASRATWDKECQCVRTCHCREPPPWEHEESRRSYHFVVGQELYYQCTQGFRAGQRDPVRSICEVSCGETYWTPPQLTCVRDGGLGPVPGDEQIPPEAPGSHTACLRPTAGAPAGTAEPAEPPAHTGAAVATEWPLPIKYLIAAACYALLLLLAGVLLLGGLAWQRKWRKMRGTI
ncbi:interleukin-2 receptor subunit alpha [Sorex fumeus]|uniref:interleukin-2 receptor subunit alpha n=1 Tax=Sorex fumeus TaxID=62283 RepID=UPI0024ADEAE6|nr:interleukin-2 receptor subunit alpha [Sorex fumeus]